MKAVLCRNCKYFRVGKQICEKRHSQSLGSLNCAAYVFDNYLVHIANDFDNYYEILSFEDMNKNVDVMSAVTITDKEVEAIKKQLTIISKAEQNLRGYFKGGS